jgi:hypothetical protein
MRRSGSDSGVIDLGACGFWTNKAIRMDTVRTVLMQVQDWEIRPIRTVLLVVVGAFRPLQMEYAEGHWIR